MLKLDLEGLDQSPNLSSHLRPRPQKQRPEKNIVPPCNKLLRPNVIWANAAILLDHYTHIITSVRDRLYRLALRVVNDADDAEDVVQDVLVKSWRQREKIVCLDNPPAWLLRMTKHQAIDRLRSAKVRSARETEAAAPDRDARTPYRIAAANDTLGHVHRLLQQLPPDQRTVLHLREVEGMEYQEIAEATGLTMQQVKTYLHRGRHKLRALLLKEKITNP